MSYRVKLQINRLLISTENCYQSLVFKIFKEWCNILHLLFPLLCWLWESVYVGLGFMYHFVFTFIKGFFCDVVVWKSPSSNHISVRHFKKKIILNCVQINNWNKLGNYNFLDSTLNQCKKKLYTYRKPDNQLLSKVSTKNPTTLL